MGIRGRARGRTQVHWVSVPLQMHWVVGATGATPKWVSGGWVRGEAIGGVVSPHSAAGRDTRPALRRDVGVSEGGTCALGRVVPCGAGHSVLEKILSQGAVVGPRVMRLRTRP